jgi:hypothetical protein
MKSVSGIFDTRQDAVRAIESLRTVGVDNNRINLLSPDSPDAQFGALPTSDSEPPGMGPALGAVVGGASGTALGLGLTSLLIPGVGVVGVLGLAATALFGAGGVLAGAAAGDKIESALDDGLPKDEIFIYEDAVRHGRSVLVAFTEDDMAVTARAEMERAGAKSIDEARHAWWHDIRDAEESHYQSVGGDFASDESIYRRGYERALDVEHRGRSYDEAHDALKACDGDDCDREAYRRGYERGHAYYRTSINNNGDGR